MKSEMRQKLARLPFEEKIRRVGQLIQLAAKLKAEREKVLKQKTAKLAKSG